MRVSLFSDSNNVPSRSGIRTLSLHMYEMWHDLFLAFVFVLTCKGTGEGNLPHPMYHPSYRALCRDSLMRVSYTKEIQYKGVLTRLYFLKRLNRRYCTISVMCCTMILYSCRCTNQLVTGWTVWSYRSKTKCEFIIPLNNYRRNYRYFFAAVPSKDRNSGL